VIPGGAGNLACLVNAFRIVLLLVCLSMCGLPAAVTAGSVPEVPARIALIIDDLGNQLQQGKQAISLPGPVACSFLPDAHFTRELARLAHTRNKEVMLHLPMQAVDHMAREPGELVLDMTQQQLMDTLLQHLDSVPNASGINNHKGSLLTRHPGHMAWLMQAIRGYGPLFFVDSRTTTMTVALQMADKYGVPGIERNVFLDNVPDHAAVSRQFRQLLASARTNGIALGIGHPYPETLAVLMRELPRLADYNVQLVPVRRLIEIDKERNELWQASWSHSHRVAKSSKPLP
jgi:polysaccharide deacetylase 2 family uncharacterized protein YibQ